MMTLKLWRPSAPALAIVLATLTLHTASAHAQTAWNFGQLLQSALASHPALQGKRAEQDAARADLEGAKWQRFPTLSVEGATPSSQQSSTLLRIDQPLWTGGRISAGIEAAGDRLGVADAALDEEGLNLTLRVIAAYSEALRQQGRQKNAASGVQEHEKLLNIIRRRVTQEVSTRTDQRLAEARTYQALNDQSAAMQAFNNALTQLAQLAGRPVLAIAPMEMNELHTPASLEAALPQALSYSPTLRRLSQEELGADADILVKRSAYLPQLSLRLEKSTGQLAGNRAMLVLSAQPGAGLSALSGVNAAIAKREALRLAHEAAERDTRERVTLDWNEWTAARLRVDNAGSSSAMSTEVFESYTRQYVIGRKTWNDVLNAVREETQSQFALEDARAQTIAASLRLAAQTGTLKQMTTPEKAP
jgi:adhesin transport system outer membrane protein